VALAREVETFQTRVWPRWQHLDEPPSDASRLRWHLWHARRLNARPLPASAEGSRVRIAHPEPVDFVHSVIFRARRGVVAFPQYNRHLRGIPTPTRCRRTRPKHSPSA
jgi:hypothetical protein